MWVAEPGALEEANQQAIASTDLGQLDRCNRYSLAAKLLIETAVGASGRYLDYGGGYGLFVRHMRDLGYDFQLFDEYCPNLFATDFAIPALVGRFDLITAFEVFEHLSDPMKTIAELLACTNTILVSTELVSEPPPALEDWHYYALEQGQHVTFYSRRSLIALAEHFGLQLVSSGHLHLLTRDRSLRSRCVAALFPLFRRYRLGGVFDVIVKRKTLLFRDFNEKRRQVIDARDSSGAAEGGDS